MKRTHRKIRKLCIFEEKLRKRVANESRFQSTVRYYMDYKVFINTFGVRKNVSSTWHVISGSY